MNFEKKVALQVHNRFPPKADVAEVIAFVKEQKLAGNLAVNFAGNGGVTSIEFIEKQIIHDGETPGLEELVDTEE